MTQTTETAAEAHALMDNLAALETACPKCRGGKGHSMVDEWVSCEPCHGTGKVAKLPGARRKCLHKGQWCQKSNAEMLKPKCLGWRPNYDARIEELEAGLTRLQAMEVCEKVAQWAYWDVKGLPDAPMPSADEIRLAKLRAIAKVLDDR